MLPRVVEPRRAIQREPEIGLDLPLTRGDMDALPLTGLHATVQALSPETRRTLLSGLERVAHGVAAAHGLVAEVAHDPGYPVTVSDDRSAEFVLETGRELLGSEGCQLQPNGAACKRRFLLRAGEATRRDDVAGQSYAGGLTDTFSRMRSTSLSSTQRAAARIAFWMASGVERPWATMHTPLTPRSGTPPYSS